MLAREPLCGGARLQLEQISSDCTSHLLAPEGQRECEAAEEMNNDDEERVVRTAPTGMSTGQASARATVKHLCTSAERSKVRVRRERPGSESTCCSRSPSPLGFFLHPSEFNVRRLPPSSTSCTPKLTLVPPHTELN